MDCARQTVAKDGVGALFKGFGPAMARVSRLALWQIQSDRNSPCRRICYVDLAEYSHFLATTQAFPANAATFVCSLFPSFAYTQTDAFTPTARRRALDAAYEQVLLSACTASLPRITLCSRLSRLPTLSAVNLSFSSRPVRLCLRSLLQAQCRMSECCQRDSHRRAGRCSESRGRWLAASRLLALSPIFSVVPTVLCMCAVESFQGLASAAR